MGCINIAVGLFFLVSSVSSRSLNDLHVLSAVSQPYGDFTKIPQLPADINLPKEYYDDRPLFGWNRNSLTRNMNMYQGKDKKTMEAVSGLIYTADNIMKQPIYDVTNKSVLFDGIDPRNYMSYAEQWWKIGDTYVRKKNVNPDVYANAPNAKHLRLTMEHVGWLGLAWYFTKNPDYSRRAKEKISLWFLDPDKAMYPNLKYAQIVPGTQIGSPQGVLEMSAVIQLFNGVALISNSEHWSQDDDKRLAAWFNEYLVWLENDAAPIEERKSVDHHGTWFDAQIMAVYGFLGRPMDAARIAYFGRQRLDYQVADRTMMYEIVEGQGLEHVQSNIEAWVSISEMADTLGIDVWNYGSSAGHSFKTVFDAFQPYWRSLGVTWPYFTASRTVRVAAELTPRMYMGYLFRDYIVLNIDLRGAFENVAQKHMARAKVLCYVPMDSEFCIEGVKLDRTCWDWRCEYTKLTVMSLAAGVLLSFTLCTVYNILRRRHENKLDEVPEHGSVEVPEPTNLDASFLEVLNKYEDLLKGIAESSSGSLTLALPNHEDFQLMCDGNLKHLP